jgi:predicted RNA-binding Zn ribbon-like protein
MRNNRRPVKSPHKLCRFVWSEHHFVNGNAALDLANTVVYRNWPDRRQDRLRSLRTLDDWRQAGHPNSALPRSLRQIVAAREVIDRFFRLAAAPAAEEPDKSAWKELVGLYASHVPGTGLMKSPGGLRLPPSGKRCPPAPLLTLVLQAAVELAFSPDFAKVKVCPGCGWLFLDRTRNGAKRWCIASLCGNRDKLRRYYRRKLRAL